MNDEKMELLIRFRDMIIQSWTFEKLTEKEKNILLNKVLTPGNTPLHEALKGTSKHCWNILQAIYSGYLMALDYEPIGWREGGEDDEKTNF